MLCNIARSAFPRTCNYVGSSRYKFDHLRMRGFTTTRGCNASICSDNNFVLVLDCKYGGHSRIVKQGKMLSRTPSPCALPKFIYLRLGAGLAASLVNFLVTPAVTDSATKPKAGSFLFA
jgi:hypothetical protein